MEEAAAQKGVGQVFFIIRGDNNNGALFGRDRLARLVNRETHLI